MEEKRNNKGVIVLLVVIIMMLSVLCILFATNTINFNEDRDNENNSNVVEEIVNNKISEWEIKEKFEYVYDYNVLPILYCGDRQEGIKIDERYYYMSTEFKTYDEMINSLKQYMSIDIISNKQAFAATNKEHYLEKDNNLYCVETNKGYLYSHNIKDIDIIKEGDNKINFVGNMELTDPDNNKQYDKVNCTIEYIDDNWIITSFEIQNN